MNLIVSLFIVFTTILSQASSIRILEAGQISNTGALLTLPTTTTNILGDNTTGTLSNKTISGATNTFVSIPASAITTGSFSNTSLSNLVAPTSVPVDLLPASDRAQNLGSNSFEWNNAYFGNTVNATAFSSRNGSSFASLGVYTTTPSGVAAPHILFETNGSPLAFATQSISFGSTGSLLFETGGATGLGFGSGDISFLTGSSLAGPRGKIILNGFSVDVNSAKIINLATPTLATDAASKGYVDSGSSTLTNKTLVSPILTGTPTAPTATTGTNSTQVATTAFVIANAGAIANSLNTYSVRVSTTINIALSGTQTIDNVSVIAGDRVLVRNQSTLSQNGVYVVSATAWARATDFSTWTNTIGYVAQVTEGSTWAGITFKSATKPGGTIDTTNILWLSSGATITSSNTANGLNALSSNTTGTENTATGRDSLSNNADGGANTATGRDSLYSNTSGNANTADGKGALRSNTTGTQNTATGISSLYFNTIGSNNTAFGANTLTTNVNGTFNTAIGVNSLTSNSAGTNNTAIGYRSLFSNDTGLSNIAVGYNAGSAITTGSNNVIIGSNTGSAIATTSNNILIADGSGNTRISADSTGLVTLSGALNLSSNKITNLAAPTVSTDAANKNYSDSLGAKNYLAGAANGNFELGTTSGFTLGVIGTLVNGLPTGPPTFGSGANAALSITASATNPLAGTYSATLASTAATTAGDMLASGSFSIDARDQAKVLTYKLYYRVNSGTLDLSGTSTSSLAVAIYDVTNSAFIPVVGAFSFQQSSGVGLAQGSFQTNVTTSNLRLIVYNANASAGAMSITVDDLAVSPSVYVFGSPVTDWAPYTVGCSGSFTTNVTYTCKKRRVGDSIEYDIGMNFTGAVNTANLSINIPDTIDTSKLALIGGAYDLGLFTITKAGSANYEGRIGYQGPNLVAPVSMVASAVGSYSIAATVTATAPATWANTDYAHMNFKVPIVGLGSNIQMSDSADTRVVAANYTGMPTGTLAAAFNLATFPNKASDTHGGYSSGAYTVKVPGFYNMAASVNVAGTFVANNFVVVGLFVDGIEVQRGDLSTYGATLNGVHPNVSIQGYPLKAGQVVDVRVYATGTSMSYVGTTANYFTIAMSSGPSQIAASESVNAGYQNTAGTAITSNIVPFPSKYYDSHNAFSANTTYTAPLAGKYRLCATLTTAVVTIGVTGGVFVVSAQQSGSATLAKYLGQAQGTGGANNYMASGCATFNMLAFDSLQIAATSSVATSLNTAAGANHFEIERVGN